MSGQIVQSNSLTEAFFRQTLVEQRMVKLAIVEAGKRGEKISATEPLAIHASRYAEEFGVHRNTAYAVLQDACERLFKKYFTFKEKNEKTGKMEVVKSRFVSDIRYMKKQGVVRFTFAPEVVRQIGTLTELTSEFTSYKLEKIADLNSKYSIRLYEMLAQWQGSHYKTLDGKLVVPDITVEEIRRRFGLRDDEYSLITQFKYWVLDPAVKEVSAKTEFIANYEQKKRGAKIVSFQFFIEKKPSKDKSNKLKLNFSDDPFAGLSDEKREIIQAEIDAYVEHLKKIGKAPKKFQMENLVKKAIDEEWGWIEYLAEKEAQQAMEKARKKKRQAELEKKTLERLAELAKAERDKTNNENFISFFENLPIDEQQDILEKLKTKTTAPFKKIFQKDLEKGKVHKEDMHRLKLLEIMGIDKDYSNLADIRAEKEAEIAKKAKKRAEALDNGDTDGLDDYSIDDEDIFFDDELLDDFEPVDDKPQSKLIDDNDMPF